MIFLKILIFFLIKFSSCDDLSSSLQIVYMVPQDEDSIYNLNEKATFGNDYTNGWILPSNEKLSLNLFLYYDGNEIHRLNSIYNLHNKINSTNTNSKTLESNNNNSSNITSSPYIPNNSKETLYMYFTTEKNNCDDYHTEQHIPLKFHSKLADNMYKAQIIVRLNYAAQPYYICMQQIDADENIYDQYRHFHHQGDNYWLCIITTKDMMPLWSRIAIFFVLLTLSGLFSGLNLGLMSLDVSELEILKRIGTVKERSYANKIYPLRKRGNFLLCTILLGNVLVNSTSTLILGDLLSGIYAAFGSTILIVLFGEIIPQAACSKHGLAVGAHTRFITIFFMILTSPVSFPLSKILDFVLGKEIAATYNREKIRELMKNVKDLEEKECMMINGALDFNKWYVNDIMTALNEVFMLDVNSKLDFETIVNIQQKGFSRIPVYEGTKDNVVGLLHVKDFTLLDPDDNMPVKALLDHYNHKVTFCYKDDKLDEMFEKFRLGETHLAFVIEIVQDEDKDPYNRCVGIVTLEDIIEKLVQLEIYDEFDDKKESKLLRNFIKNKII
jgi:metal transporter CNNM